MPKIRGPRVKLNILIAVESVKPVVLPTKKFLTKSVVLPLNNFAKIEVSNFLKKPPLKALRDKYVVATPAINAHGVADTTIKLKIIIAKEIPKNIVGTFNLDFALKTDVKDLK